MASRKKGGIKIPKARTGTAFYENQLRAWGFVKASFYSGWTKDIHLDSGRYQVLVSDLDLKQLPPRSVQALVMGLIVTAFVSGRNTVIGVEAKLVRAQGMIDNAKKVLNG